MAQVLRVDLAGTTKIKKFSPSARFPREEILRIICYAKGLRLDILDLNTIITPPLVPGPSTPMATSSTRQATFGRGTISRMSRSTRTTQSSTREALSRPQATFGRGTISRITPEASSRPEATFDRGTISSINRSTLTTRPPSRGQIRTRPNSSTLHRAVLDSGTGRAPEDQDGRAEEGNERAEAGSGQSGRGKQPTFRSYDGAVDLSPEPENSDVKSQTSSATFKYAKYFEFPGAYTLPTYLTEFGDKPWDDDDTDYGNGPPPPIPGFVEMEIEIQKDRIDRSNRDIKSWLSKV
ncbi:hypothetical protein MMC31_001500 [Peltigera leucophlebia]|nr:hypothetical protein [Peltigera leucophlebia]